ncbi:MAG: spore coat assemly protein [Clostridia bacterium]|nr:spore coat assemly protein [Clostridia bacterium]
MDIKPGDVVARKSHGKDIFFKVKSLIVTENGTSKAILRGLDVRLIADAPCDDLELQPAQEILRYRHNDIKKHNKFIRCRLQRRELQKETILKRVEERKVHTADYDNNKDFTDNDFFEVPPRVLHIDGDEEYLDKCLHAYKQLKLSVKGVYIPENQQAAKVKDLLREYTPDILVLTGHDGLIKKNLNISSLDSYRNSKHFVAAIREARSIRTSHDDLIIFAGACQSNYEALLEAGATFASSPLRVLIHAYDPVLIVERISFTSIDETIAPEDIIKETITGDKGIGGMEIKGKLRIGYPNSVY